MSISSVVTRGYGSWGSANLVVTRGYSIGSAVITPPNNFIPRSVHHTQTSKSVHYSQISKVVKGGDVFKVVK